MVEEVLLASRLDAAQVLDTDEPVDPAGRGRPRKPLAWAPRASGDNAVVQGSERLLRRAMRNLLENARRYGQREVEVTVFRDADGGVGWRVCDRGPGVPEAFRERIFEPFFPPARTCRARGRRGPGPEPGAANRRTPWRPCAMPAASRRRHLLRGVLGQGPQTLRRGCGFGRALRGADD